MGKHTVTDLGNGAWMSLADSPTPDSITPDTIRAELEAAGVILVQSPDGDREDMFVLNNGHNQDVTWGQRVDDYDYDYCLGDVLGVGVELLEYNQIHVLHREDYKNGPSFACAIAKHIGHMGAMS